MVVLVGGKKNVSLVCYKNSVAGQLSRCNAPGSLVVEVLGGFGAAIKFYAGGRRN